MFNLSADAAIGLPASDHLVLKVLNSPHQPSALGSLSSFPSASVAAALALTLAACGGGGDATSDAAATSQAVSGTTVTQAFAPAALATASDSPSNVLATADGEVVAQLPDVATANEVAMALRGSDTVVIQTSGSGRMFYVDSRTGNDAANGTASVKGAGSSGPWLTLAKATAQLQPGDTLLLNCGSVWNETLKVNTSGTAALPITIRSNPATCAAGTIPAIDGVARVSNTQWVRHAANVYRVQLPLQQLDNPKFDAGVGRWRWTSDSGTAQLSALTNCGPDGSACMKLVSGTNTAGRSLAYSATFPMAAGAKYRIRFAIKATPGVFVRAFVRRGGSPYEVVGTVISHTGTGAWASLSGDFTGLAQLENARVDFDLPGGGHMLMVDDVTVERIVDAPFAAHLGTEPLVVAHHPNRGHSATEPTSPYLRLPADADNVVHSGTKRGSTYIPHPNLALPAGVSLRAGTRIRIRTTAWLMDDRQITSVSAGKLVLDAPTSYPLKAGWGFFMLGEPWMLDEAGEWHYDAGAAALTVRTATDLAPTAALSLGVLDTCVDIAARQYVSLEGLALNGCRVGVKVTSSTSVALKSLRITDSAVNAVAAGASRNLQVLNSHIERSGEHAVLAKEGTLGLAIGMTFSGNTVLDSAATRVNGKVVSLPVQSVGAVIAGEQVTVTNNIVSGSGYHGIRTFGSGLVQGNKVDNACLMLDDCGGIYAFGEVQGTRIVDNIVRDLAGNQDGKPIGSTSQAQGIFLDDHAHGVTVTGNTVAGAETGIFLHNAYNNTISGNVLYGNRKHQLWLMEDAAIVNAAGDVRNNTVTSNLMFATNASAAVGQESFVQQTAQFASYDGNRYSALITNRVVSEAWPSGSNAFQFPDWQRAALPNGTPRNQDGAGSVVNAIGYASIRVIGSTIVPNGNMASGALGWTPWNATAPLAAANATSCSGTPCLEVTGGGSVTLVATPAFSVAADSWYRVSFDARSTVANMPVSALVRRGGGGTNGYESLMGTAEMVNVPASTKRFSFMFKATKTINANDAVTRDIGARLYFDRLQSGSKLYLSNVEVVPVTAADAALQTHLLTNSTNTVFFATCPDAGTGQSARCTQYVNFATGTGVTWPIQLAVGKSAVVYSRDTTLVDSDSDGIADTQDVCIATTAGAATNARGCALGQ